jgi:hypothetical protein
LSAPSTCSERSPKFTSCESLGILAACVHPEAFGDLAAKHASNAVRLGPDAAIGRLS